MKDNAWINDDYKTNNKLKDGMRVQLLSDTVANSSSFAPTVIKAGSVGIVAHAKTPRISRKGYFANIDLDSGVRVRVPHNALLIIDKELTRK